MLRAGDTDLSWNIEVRVAFGPLVERWILGPFELAPGEETEVEVDLATDGWLHTLSDTYVTDVSVTAWGEDEATWHALGLGADDLVLAFPDGISAVGVTWTRAEAALWAPHGVLDRALQLAADELDPDARLMPPIWEEFPKERAKGDGTRIADELPAMEKEVSE